MKIISLTEGQFAMVDDSDYEFFMRFKWRTQHGTNTFYASRNAYLPGRNYKTIYMQHHIFPFSLPYQIDHIDGNGLNNQRSNLRLCTASQNRINQPKRVIGTSKFKGVSWASRDMLWTVRLRIDGKCKNLGSFKDEIEAAKTYDKFASQHFGEFAKLNFPEVMA